MNKRKKPIALFLSMLMVFMLLFSAETAVRSAPKKVIKLKKISLNHSTYKLQKGKTLKLKASFKPKKTTQKKITWKSSKKSVAKVSKKGVVKALKVGKATITAKVKGTKKKATCKIQVILNNGDGTQDDNNNNDNLPIPDSPTVSPSPGQEDPTELPGSGNPLDPSANPDPGSSSAPDINPDETPASPSETPIGELIPTKEPGVESTKAPADKPTNGPTKAPADKPTNEPTKVPADKPTTGSTSAPTGKPITGSTSAPTGKPVTGSTTAPTDKPTTGSTSAPTGKPITGSTSAPTDKPTIVSTSSPTSTPTTKPTPKYERPDVTAPPVKPIALTEDGAYQNEMGSSGATIENNPDGSITITLMRQYAAVNFYLPDNAQNYYSNYKSVVLTYTCEGGNLSHALYDATMMDATNPEDLNKSKHPNWGSTIPETGEEQTIIFTVTNDCAGGCIQGFQIFNPAKLEDGKSITITVKSIVFSDKENPTAEDLNPAATTTPTPVPTATPTPLPPLITREPGEYNITGPYTKGNSIIWDTITFGSYYQSLYEPLMTIESPAEGQVYTDSDGTEMIYTGGNYYKKEPIIWRVLSVNGNDAFLMADQNLDTQTFNEEYCHTTSWKDSSIRRWLNEEFYTTAFTDQEKSSILSTDLSSEENKESETEDVTGSAEPAKAAKTAETDNVYLLSAEETINMNYGFAIHHGTYSVTRQAENTAYARQRGAWTNNDGDYAGNGWWWLRTSGNLPFDAAYVGSEGFTDCSGFIAVNTGGGVRPVLHINLMSKSWNPADKVSTDSATELLPTPVPTENPRKQVTLSGVRMDPSSIGYYDIDTDSIYINDTRTGEGGDVTFMYLPIPVTVQPGEKLKVTVSGPAWGTKDFRIWATPSSNTGSGDYVEDANIFLKPTINADGSYTGTVELTTVEITAKGEKGKECNCITIKAQWGVTIQDLIISEIIVERIKTSEENP